MSRIGRVILPNYPHHIVRRGHNRQVVFAESSDYLGWKEGAEGIKIHQSHKLDGPPSAER